MTLTQVTFYISAAPEMKDERDALGRLVSSIPTTLGWDLVQTPYGDQQFNPEAVLRAGVHVLVLGADIKAPVGLEWLIARRAGRSPVLFRQERLRTPAADAFVRDLGSVAAWRVFRDTPDLVQQVSALLADHLLAHAAQYALSLPEIERLRAWQKREPSAAQAPGGETRRVTDSSGVILTPERYLPSEGTIVE